LKVASSQTKKRNQVLKEIRAEVQKPFIYSPECRIGDEKGHCICCTMIICELAQKKLLEKKRDDGRCINTNASINSTLRKIPANY